jgi:geranylgeranyl pyrophosphate synthase
MTAPVTAPARPVVVAAPAAGGRDVDDALRRLAAHVPHVEARMAQHIKRTPMPARLRESIEYSALGPGKRLRPMLAVHSCVAVGGSPERAYDAAAAVELIHAFSLVHDDLPAMDNDDLRRGRPTNHVVFGETMAILAGDAMVSLAFALLTPDAGHEVDPALAGLLASEMAAGTTGMIAGQVYDTLGGFPEGLDERRRLELIHRHKTGALIRASCRMGALAGAWPNVEPGALDAITRYGDSVGLMFQVVDDILDVEQTAARLGKRANKDAEAGKATFPGVLGLDESRQEVCRLRAAALDAIRPLGARASGLVDLCELMAVRDR